MKQPVFQGTCVAIVTPLKDGKVNFAKLSEILDQQIEAGVAAVAICGTTGEAPTLKSEEHLEAIRHTIRHCAGRMKVIAGTGSNDTMHSLYMSQSAADAGADALLHVTPYYNKPTQRGLIAHYTYIADRVKCPLILYNVPSRTGTNIAVDTCRVLSEHPNINGIKEASGSITHAMHILNACGDQLTVWSGNDDQIVPLMSIGAKGVISVLSNVAPRQTVAITDACLRGDFAEAARLQLRYLELIDALFCETNPIPVKTAMNLMGMEVGPVKLPLVDMEEKNLERLKAALKDAELL